jgi:5-methylcytosine-specific restriction endonuclease McrA
MLDQIQNVSNDSSIYLEKVLRRRQQKAAYYFRNKEAIQAKRKKFYEDNPNRAYARKEYVKVYCEINSEKRKKYAKEYYQANKDKVKEYRKKYFKTESGIKAISKWNRRKRVRRLGADGFYDWDICLKIYGNKCAICKSDNKKLEADHIIPLTKGGTNWQFNIQPLCKSCNCSKYNRIDISVH